MMSKHWKQVSLESILSERREIPLSEEIFTGNIPVISKIRFSDGKIEFRHDTATKTGMILIQPGDLVLSGINAMKGAVALYEPDEPILAAATIHYSAYQINDKLVDKRFLWWLLRSPFFRDVLEQQVPQGIKTELKAKRLLPVVVPLPSLDEQQQIVGRIEAVAKRIDEATALQSNSLTMTKFLLASAISKLLAPYPARKPLDAFFAEPLRNGLSLKAKDMGGDKGIPFLKLGAVGFGIFDPGQVKLVNIDLPKDSPFWVHPGDILIGRGNSIELVGRTVFYRDSPYRYAYPDLIIRIRINSQLADPEFIDWYFKSSEAREYIQSNAQGTSPTMKKVSQPLLSRMPIPDIPLKTQKEMVGKMKSLQERVSEMQNTMNEAQPFLSALLPAVLVRAFRGEL